MKKLFTELLFGFILVAALTLLGYVWCTGCAPTLNTTDKETVVRFERMNKYPYAWYGDRLWATRLHSDSIVEIRFEEEYVVVDSVIYSGRWVSPSMLEVDNFYDYRTQHGDMDSTILFRIAVHPDVLKITLDTSLRGSGLERFEGSYKLPLKY